VLASTAAAAKKQESLADAKETRDSSACMKAFSEEIYGKSTQETQC